MSRQEISINTNLPQRGHLLLLIPFCPTAEPARASEHAHARSVYPCGQDASPAAGTGTGIGAGQSIVCWHAWGVRGRRTRWASIRSRPRLPRAPLTAFGGGGGGGGLGRVGGVGGEGVAAGGRGGRLIRRSGGQASGAGVVLFTRTASTHRYSLACSSRVVTTGMRMQATEVVPCGSLSTQTGVATHASCAYGEVQTAQAARACSTVALVPRERHDDCAFGQQRQQRVGSP